VQLVNWMKEVGVAEELADEKYNDDFFRQTQLRHSNEIHAGIHRLLAKVPAHEAFLRGQSLGLAWAAVHAPEDNLEYEHYKQRGYWAEIDHEEIGKTILYPRGLYSNNELGSMPKRRAPHLGEHTRDILTGDLGLGAAEVDALVKTEVVR
jgi:crotonobetainyl-CoA:carnitine CoA-transferase CaiB-like acyl-CoA transferase